MADKIQFRRDTSINRQLVNPKLAVGELAYETDTGMFKIGDGGTAYNSIRYALVITNGVQTLTNKTISGSSNTLSNIPNSALVNNTISINGNNVALGSSLAWGSWTTISTNTNTNAVPNRNYFVDSNSAVTLTLPASPSQGDEIRVFDATGMSYVNNIIINPNGGKINGLSDVLWIDAAYAALSLIYYNSTYGWKVLK